MAKSMMAPKIRTNAAYIPILIHASTFVAVTNPSPPIRPPEALISFVALLASTSATIAKRIGQDTKDNAARIKPTIAIAEVEGPGVTTAGRG